MSDIMFVDVECTGESTRTKYVGKFEIKLNLNFKEMAEQAREANRMTHGLKRTPSWDLDGFIKGLKDDLEGIEEDAKLNLTEQQIDRIVKIAAIAIPLGDPEADIMAAIADCNAHIVSAPEWWGRTKGEPGGYTMHDYAPVAALQAEINKLRLSLAKPSI